jgi:anti-sigma regulatory factor (Ser/Thr protein kinase)
MAQPNASRLDPVTYPLVSQMPPLGALATAPGSARAHLRSTLKAWHMSLYQEIAELLTSELVTNAVEASSDGNGQPIYFNGSLPVVIFRMLAYKNSLVLEVWDMTPSAPEVWQADALDEHGRGMFLVETLASRWNWKTAPNWPGKCVWAEIKESSSDQLG